MTVTRWLSFLAVALVCATQHSTGAVVTNTVTFQPGVDGYDENNVHDRRISMNTNVDGSAVDTESSTFYIDGDPEDAARSDYLIRFDNILGGSGIPAGAVILDASLSLRTTSEAVSVNSESPESYNLYRLTKPFDSNSTLDGDFGDGDGLFTYHVDGVEPEQGEADFILGTYDHPVGANPARLDFDMVYSAPVTRAVQSWVNGDPNYGIAVVSDHVDQDNGWSVHSSGAPTASYRPKLSVTYTTNPNVSVHEFQQGLNGFAGTTDVILNLATDVGGTDERDDDTVLPGLDASTRSEVFLDGDDSLRSYDTPYLVKFDNVEALATPGLDHEVLKAELIITTGFSSTASDSSGPYTIHQMLVPFSTSSVYGDFAGDAAAMELAGQIGPEIARLEEIEEAELMIADISGAVQNWLNGAPNYGLYIGPADGTTDGWQIFTSGAVDPDLAPMLRVYTAVPEPTALALAGLGLGLLAWRRR